MSIKRDNKKRGSDGYKRKELLSAMNEPGSNLTTLSKELKKLAVFMHNSNSKSEKEVVEPVKEERIVDDDSFKSIDNFLQSSGVEETSLDDILKSEGYSSDYFSMSDCNEDNNSNEDNQISSINSFLNAVENGKFKNCNEGSEEENNPNEESLEEEEYSKPIEEEFLTESLAHIYIKQRKYERALEIIRSISLKNPEKNIYFADQIRFLEKLIINVKPE